MEKLPTNRKRNNTFDFKHFSEFINEFKSESDRAAVVLGAAKLDQLLYRISQAFLIPVPSGRDELLDGDSPLGTFSSKINFVYRCGLIDADFARALHLVRRIRNSFAHEVSGCSLTSGAHSDRVRELARPLKHLPFYNKFTEYFFGKEKGTNIDFRATLAIMVARLEACLSITETTKVVEVTTFIIQAMEEDD